MGTTASAAISVRTAQEGFTNPLIVRKEGYDDPTGLPPRTWPGSPLLGWRDVTINGDTRFDIELVRR